MDGTFGDGGQEVRVARTAQATVAVEVGDDPRRVFHRLLVEVAAVLGNLVGKFGVGTQRELRNVGLDRVARVGGETVVHVAELTFTFENSELVVAAGNARGVLGHVDASAASGGEVAFEVSGPLFGGVGNNGCVHITLLVISDGVLVSETGSVGGAFEFAFRPEGDRHVVVLDVAGFGVVDLVLESDFGVLGALVDLVVPRAEVEHVALGAVGQTGAASTGGKLGVEALGLELVDELGHFLAARGGVGESLDVPVVVVTASESFLAALALGKLSAAHATGSQSGKVGASAAPEGTTRHSGSCGDEASKQQNSHHPV